MSKNRAVTITEIESPNFNGFVAWTSDNKFVIL